MSSTNIMNIEYMYLNITRLAINHIYKHLNFSHHNFSNSDIEFKLFQWLTKYDGEVSSPDVEFSTLMVAT